MAAVPVSFARPLAIGAGYGVLSCICLSFTRFGAPVESIWLSNTLLVWALATSPRVQWAPIVACSAVGHVTAHLLSGDALDFTLAFLAGDMAEGVLCALLLPAGVLAFQTRRDVFRFLAVCGLIGPLASATIAAAASLVIGRPMGGHDFGIWFAADALGLLVFLPILYNLGRGRWNVLKGKGGRLAVAACAVLVFSLGAAWMADLPALRLLLLPLFVLIAFELGVAGVQVCLAVLLAIWSAMTVAGRPPVPWFESSMRDYMLVTQIFLAIFSATLLPLAVIIEEKKRLTQTLADCLKETREAWGAIIGAEARYRLVVDNVSETVIRAAPDGLVLFASPACNALLHGKNLQGRNIFDLMHPDDASAEREHFRQCLSQGLVNLANRWRWRLRGDDGAWTAIDARVTLVAPGGSGDDEFIIVMRPEEHRDALPLRMAS